MEEYLLQGPPAYKRPRLVDSLQASANFLGFPAMSSQFLPPSSTTSSAEMNNIRPINMQQNYGLNSFGEPAVTATQPHSQPGIAHSTTSVNLFSDDAVGGSMRIPVTSSIGSARPQFEAFNSRQPGPRPMVHDQVPGSSIPIGFPADSTQFMPNPEQLIAPNILHSMNALMASPVGQFMPSSAVVSQQRFNDLAQNVLSENSSIINSRLQSKEWHKSVTFNIRNRLIRKMAQILSMCPDTQTGSLDNRMHNCISIATSVENETYRTANSMTQYYDVMAKRCHFISNKERGNSTQPGTQYYNLQDIRQTYEALGIAYPMGPAPYPANGGPNNNVGGGGNGGPNNNASGGGGMRLHAGEATQPPPPPPGVMPGLMGAAGGPMPYCFAGRGQPSAAVQPPGGHNQPLLGADEELEATIQELAEHAYKACQAEETVQRDIVVVEHWDRCASQDCPTCQRSLAATTTSMNNPMNVNPVFMPRRPHRGGGGGGGSSYPSTATSGLLGNQSSQPSPGGPGSGGSIPPVGSGRSGERIPPRSSMWHSRYNDGPGWWRSIGGPDMSMDGGGGGGGGGGDGGRRTQQRFWLPNRNPGNRHERRTPYNNPWSAPEIIFVENSRGGGQPPRGTALFGPIGSGRNMDRLHAGPYGVPWRSPDVLLVENIRPAHRQAQDPDEPVIIPPEEDATPTEHQQMMAIVKVVKTHGGRLEQKYRCSRRSCSASWPCLHRRLAASIQSHKTPIPG